MSHILGVRVKFVGSPAWTGQGTVTDGHLNPDGREIAGCTVDWDDASAPQELRGWIAAEMLEEVTR